MKRSISRRKALPAFSTDLNGLVELHSTLKELVSDPEHVHSRLRVEVPGETLEFDNVEELKGQVGLPAKIRTVSLFVLGSTSRSISIRSGWPWGTRATASIDGESEVWVAGALAAVERFARLRRQPYHLLFAVPAFSIMLGMAMSSMIIAFYASNANAKANSMPFVLVAGTAIALLATLSILQLTLMHGLTLIVRREEGILRQFATEITVASAVVVAVAALVALFR